MNMDVDVGRCHRYGIILCNGVSCSWVVGSPNDGINGKESDTGQ